VLLAVGVSEADTVIVNVSQEFIVSFDSIPRDIEFGACGLLLVTSNLQGFLFSLADYTWRTGPTLPADLVQVDYTFNLIILAIGGKESEELGLAVITA